MYNCAGCSDIEHPTARYISETQVDTGHHGPPSVDRLIIHDEHRSRRSPVTSSSRAATSPDNWLSHYSRHYSLPAGSVQPAAGSAAVDRRDSWPVTEDGEDDDGSSTFRSDSSTPEPPLSARPKNLDNHPKILKDQLHHSMASLGTTHEVKFLNRSWTFAGR